MRREGITVTLPNHRSINDLSDYYPKGAFTYDADQDCYICPAGERLTYKTVNREGVPALLAALA